MLRVKDPHPNDWSETFPLPIDEVHHLLNIHSPYLNTRDSEILSGSQILTVVFLPLKIIWLTWNTYQKRKNHDLKKTNENKPRAIYHLANILHNKLFTLHISTPNAGYLLGAQNAKRLKTRNWGVPNNQTLNKKRPWAPPPKHDKFLPQGFW